MNKPRNMSQEAREQGFLQKAREKHGDKFVYDDFEYVNAKTAGKIVCPNHGDFFQSPDKHLNSVHACTGCLLENKKPRTTPFKPKPMLSEEEYLGRLLPLLPEGYTVEMSNYLGITRGTVVLHCPNHGRSEYSPRSLLLSKYACRQCARNFAAEAKTKSFDDFIRDANIKHKSKYTYSSDEFTNRLGSIP